MTLILLIRHGQNDWVKKGRLAGWIPGVHLNETGRKQAQQLATRLCQMPLNAIYSSPVIRCLETARTIADLKELPITELPEVGEVRYGKWEGKKIKKLAKKKEWYAVQHYPSRFTFPDGESFSEVKFRAVSAIESLVTRHEKEIVAVVSHADVIKLVLAHYLGVPLDLFQRIGLSPASVSVLALSANGMVRVLRINDDGPLKPPSEPKKKGGSGQDQEESDAQNKPQLSPAAHLV